MYNKDSLKPRNGRKLNNVIAVLMSALLATGVMIGCGSDTGGTKNSDSAGGTSNVAAAETVNDSATEVSTNEAEDELPPQAYKTTEERQAQHVLDLDLKPMHSNQFLMIEEVINEPEEGWEVNSEIKLLNCDYIKLKGTLYETNLYDEPATDLVYFPGDELPEGYEVNVTEDYEVVVVDAGLIPGHVDSLCVSYIATDENTEVVYEEGIGFIWNKPDGSTRDEMFEEYGRYVCKPSFTPGMYVMLEPPGIYDLVNVYYVTQLLTKEDLEKLPAETTIAHGVGHY